MLLLTQLALKHGRSFKHSFSLSSASAIDGKISIASNMSYQNVSVCLSWLPVEDLLKLFNNFLSLDFFVMDSGRIVQSEDSILHCFLTS